VRKKKKRKKREQHSLVYPRHLVKPQDVLDFVEMDGFEEDWKRLGLNDDDLSVLQVCLMSMPTSGRIIRGSGGVRKSRFAPKRWGTGKSGAARVYYKYFPEYSMTLLIGMYAKNELENISAAQRNAMKAAVERIERELSKRPVL
jgi:hypothetical protein